MAEDVAAVPDKTAKRIGWGLLAFALTSPALMGAAGVISAFKVGELTVQVGFAWLGAAVVIDLLTKKRAAIAKANGRIVAATLALVMALVSGFNVYRDTQKVDTAKRELIEQFMASTVEAKNAPAQPAAASEPTPTTTSAAAAPPQPSAGGGSDADKAVAVLGAMKLRTKKFAEDSGALERKFNAVDLSTVLAPQNILSSTGLQASRKTLAAYTGLIHERGAMLKQHFALTEQIIRGSGMSKSGVNDGLAGMNSRKGPISQTYAELDSAQLASVKAISDLLNFAERNLGRISVRNGQLMFQAQPELDEYQRLMQGLTNAAAKEGDVAQRVNAQAQASKQALVDEIKK